MGLCPRVTAIPSKKRGRHLTLGEMDLEVQIYIRALQVAGTPVGSAVVVAAARGIVIAKDPVMLAENGA